MFNFDFNTLVLFKTVAKTESFTAAAETLGMGQPTLSRKIAQLENMVGINLFYRGSKAIKLTSSGIQFLETVEQMLDEYSSCVSLIKDDPDDIKGEVTLGALPAMMRWLSAEFIADFCQQYPNIKLNLTLLSFNNINEMFDGDLMLCPSLPTDDNLVVRKLFTSSWYFYASPQFIEKFGKPKSPSELAKFKFISNALVQKDKHHVPYINGKGVEKLARIKPIIVTDSIDTARTLGHQGLGATLLPYSQATDWVNEGKLVELFDHKYLHQFGYHMVYRSRKYMPLRFKVLLDALQTFYGKNVPLNLEQGQKINPAYSH